MRSIQHVLLVAVATSGCFGSGEDPGDVDDRVEAASARRSFIVISKAETLPPGLEKKLAANGGTVKRVLPELGAVLVEASPATFASRARKLTEVRSIMPSVRRQYLESARCDPLPQSPNAAALNAPVFAVTAPRADGPVPPPCAPPGEPTDTYYKLQWGLEAVGARRAWEQGVCGRGVRVAVLDTGVAYDPFELPHTFPPVRSAFHPELRDNLNIELSTSMVVEPMAEPFYVPVYPAPCQNAFHGTHVMGIIGADRDHGGTVGVAPGVELVAVKVLDSRGRGSEWQILEGIWYAAKIHADVANLSLGAVYPRTGFCDAEGCFGADDVSELINLYRRAVNFAAKQGMTIVASAGNDAIDFDSPKENLFDFPGSLPQVITVSATAPSDYASDPEAAKLDEPAIYTNFGGTFVDFAAPGGDFSRFDPNARGSCFVPGFGFVFRPCWRLDGVVSTLWPEAEWEIGTSMAAPHVSGLAALVISKARSEGRKLTTAQVERELRASALDLGKRGNDDFYGTGLAHWGACAPACPADRQCGKAFDGCGNLVDCGGCGDGAECHQGQCCPSAESLCAAQDLECGGTFDPVCQRAVACGSCAGGAVCAPDGSGGTTCCASTACEDQGRTCGSALDTTCGIFGLFVDCGTCPGGELCTGGGSCCEPTVCEQTGLTCGSAFDFTCGAWVDCGTCGDAQTCIDGSCCAATVCQDEGRCGFTYDERCGTWVDCGGCGDGQLCDNFVDGTCCTPTACQDQGRTCGPVFDCGIHLVTCGACECDETCDASGSCCQPLTCEALERACGSVEDGCGGAIWCGGCADGEACTAAGECCRPRTCEEAGLTCGWADDGCGGSIYCDRCADGVCVAKPGQTGECCRPRTCEETGVTCGEADDGCGGSIYCDRCAEGVCVAKPGQTGECCLPSTCEQLGVSCGWAFDGCSEWIYCDQCSAGEVCTGFACCAPTATCESEGRSCGELVDDCGVSRDCGACADDETCTDGVCMPPPPPALTCPCNDKARISYCPADGRCPVPAEQDRICALACATHGGARSPVCDSADRCAGPDPFPPPP